jgi:predicted HD superfamily hydrolase involved in NAD metabolism
LIALKTRNGVVISPHPRAKNATIAASKIVLDAAVEAGAPKDIIGWIEAPSLPKTNLLMKESDLILATGGPGMVKAAYSSGTPALGVGAGNTPAIIDETADLTLAVSSIIHSKTFDNGMICASEQSVIILDSVYDEVKALFRKMGCHLLSNAELEKTRKTILINGALNAKIVGQKPVTIAELAGFKVDEDLPSPVVHAFLGAFIAENELGIKDSELIDAIRYHTSGKPEMSTLAKLVFVADMVEEDRNYEGVEYLRELFEKDDFEKCFIECLKEEVLHLLNKKQYIYKATLDAYDYYVKERK